MRYLTGDTCAPAAPYPPLRSVGGESIRPSCGRSSPRFNFTSKAGSVQGRQAQGCCLLVCGGLGAGAGGVW